MTTGSSTDLLTPMLAAQFLVFRVESLVLGFGDFEIMALLAVFRGTEQTIPCEATLSRLFDPIHQVLLPQVGQWDALTQGFPEEEEG